MSSPDVNPDGFEVVETDVLVVGSGPIGMITAYQLAHCGQSCILVEQNYETTEYPKMELTQARTMELFRRFGLADELRALGVPPEHNLNEIITTGYGEKGSVITLWERDSPNTQREKWARDNDGSHPVEPWMRLSQILMERWLKSKVQKTKLISSHWGRSFQTLVEKDNAVYSTVTDPSAENVV